MKRRYTQLHDENADNGDALMSEEIDRLYGLEPVIDIEKATNEGIAATQYVLIACPYCGESYNTSIDLTGGSFEYVEDCQICCQPIDLKVDVNEAGELHGVVPRQSNA